MHSALKFGANTFVTTAFFRKFEDLTSLCRFGSAIRTASTDRVGSAVRTGAVGAGWAVRAGSVRAGSVLAVPVRFVATLYKS